MSPAAPSTCGLEDRGDHPCQLLRARQERRVPAVDLDRRRAEPLDGGPTRPLGVHRAIVPADDVAAGDSRPGLERARLADDLVALGRSRELAQAATSAAASWKKSSVAVVGPTCQTSRPRSVHSAVVGGTSPSMGSACRWSLALRPGWARNAARKISRSTGRRAATSGTTRPAMEWPTMAGGASPPRPSMASLTTVA